MWPSANGERWRRQVASVNLMTHRPSTVGVNSLCVGLIMVSGGQLIRSVNIVGNQGMKALMQMDCACNSPRHADNSPG
jgi:hypothetical protein